MNALPDKAAAAAVYVSDVAVERLGPFSIFRDANTVESRRRKWIISPPARVLQMTALEVAFSSGLAPKQTYVTVKSAAASSFQSDSRAAMHGRELTQLTGAKYSARRLIYTG